MEKFIVPLWEKNRIADERSKELSKLQFKKRKKSTIKFVENSPAKCKSNNKSEVNKNVEISMRKSKNKNSTQSSKQMREPKQLNFSLSKKKLNKKAPRNNEQNKNGVQNKKNENVFKNSSNISSIKEKSKRLKEKLSKMAIVENKREKFKKFNKPKEKLNVENIAKKKNKKEQSLREKMMERLKGAHFRLMNEEIYLKEGKEAFKYFRENPEAYKSYHDGYRQQVKLWPLNPLDVIIKQIKTLPKNYIVADMGCGEAKLSKSVPQKVHSFDLVSSDPNVIACDMSRTGLKNESVDIVVFCLSLMGTNLTDYLKEANRILKHGGKLKIAEVESRFNSVDEFITNLRKFGFVNTSKDLTKKLFYYLEFKKVSNVNQKNKLPNISLKPCMYKKR